MNRKIILASQSPRRQQLLAEMGISFTAKSLDINEDFPKSLNAQHVARYLAEKKADNYVFQEDEAVITADTTVVLDHQILGKPGNAEEARDMLEKLSGKMHEVITGVCVGTKLGRTSFDDTTKVWFREITAAEIQNYIQTYHPFDKAGSYAIQEWIGMIGIEKIEGSYFNVVGLPTEKLYKTLKAMQLI